MKAVIEKISVKTIIFFFLAAASVAIAEGWDAVVLESQATMLYEETVSGFESACKCTIKEVMPLDAVGAQVYEIVRKHQPDMILAIGEEALTTANRFKDIPATYVFVMNPAKIAPPRNNLHGVSMVIDPEKQLIAFLDVLPHIKNIGLIYTAEKTDPMLEHIRAVAKQRGVTLVERRITDAKAVYKETEGMKQGIDALWIVPDYHVVTPEVSEFLALFSMEHSVPLMAFTEKKTSLGATISLTVDPYDMGLQAAHLTLSVFSGTRSSGIASLNNNGTAKQEVEVRIARITINQPVAQKMHLALDEKYKNRSTAKLDLSKLALL